MPRIGEPGAGSHPRRVNKTPPRRTVPIQAVGIRGVAHRPAPARQPHPSFLNRPAPRQASPAVIKASRQFGLGLSPAQTIARAQRHHKNAQARAAHRAARLDVLHALGLAPARTIRSVGFQPSPIMRIGDQRNLRDSGVANNVTPSYHGQSLSPQRIQAAERAVLRRGHSLAAQKSIELLHAAGVSDPFGSHTPHETHVAHQRYRAGLIHHLIGVQLRFQRQYNKGGLSADSMEIRNALKNLPTSELERLMNWRPSPNDLLHGQVSSAGFSFSGLSQLASGVGGLVRGGIKANIPGVAGKLAAGAAGDLVELGGEMVPSLYHSLEPLAHGRVDQAASRFAQPFVDLARHPGKSIMEHPLGSFLIASGALRGADRGAGYVLRHGNERMRSAGSTDRGNAVLPDTRFAVPRRYSRGVTVKHVQKKMDLRAFTKARDFYKQAHDAETEAVRVQQHGGDATALFKRAQFMRKQAYLNDPSVITDASKASPRTTVLQRGHDEYEALVEGLRRIDRSRVTKAAQDALGKDAGNLVRPVAEGIVAASRESVEGYLRSIRDEAKKLDPVVDRRKLLANEQLQGQLRDALENPKTNMDHVLAAAERYRKVVGPLQKELADRKLVDPARADKAALVSYAVRFMGAKLEREHYVSRSGRKISKREFDRLRADHGRDAATRIPDRVSGPHGRPFTPDEIRAHMRAARAGSEAVPSRPAVPGGAARAGRLRAQYEAIAAHERASRAAFERAKAARSSFPRFKHDYQPSSAGINAKAWFHGTNHNNLRVEDLDGTGTSEANLFGQGVYLTDNPEVAASYAASRSRRSGEPTVYRASLHVKHPLDMEHQAQEPFVDALRKAGLSISHMAGGDRAVVEAVDRATARGATNADVYKAFRDAVTELSHDYEIPRTEFVEHFQDLASDLRARGFDALTHVGGKRVGGMGDHQVTILLDPANTGAIEGAGRQATSFAKHTQDRPEPVYRSNGARVEAARVAAARAASDAQRMTEARPGREPQPFISDPVYVSQQPRLRSSGAYFKRWGPRVGVQVGKRTGKAVTEGTIDVHPSTLVDQAARTQALISADKAFQGHVDELGFRRGGKLYEAGTKRDALELADQLSAHGSPVEWTPIRLNPLGGNPEALSELLDATRHDSSTAQQGIHEMLADAYRSADGDGPWGLIPKQSADRAAAHQKLLGQEQGVKAIQKATSLFRKVVLMRPSFPFGNAFEATVRGTLKGALPFTPDYFFMKRILDALPAAHRDSVLEGVVKGGHYSMVSKANVHMTVDQFGESKMARAAQGVAHTPPAKLITAAWEHWNHFFFQTVNATIERQFTTALAGKAVRQQFFPHKLVALSDKSVQEAAQGLTDTPTQRLMGREVARAYGKYDAFTPEERRWLLLYSPFGAWMLNSIRFVVQVLPRDHPVVTALIAAATQTSEEWRKAHKLTEKAIPGQKPLPGFLQGSIPGAGGSHLRTLTHYTPAGFWADPGDALAGAILPQFSGLTAALRGTDWKGTPLKDATIFGRAAEMLKEGAAEVVPGFGQEQQIFTGKGTLEQRVRKFFDPFMYTKSASTGRKPSARSSKPLDPVDAALKQVGQSSVDPSAVDAALKQISGR